MPSDGKMMARRSRATPGYGQQEDRQARNPDLPQVAAGGAIAFAVLINHPVLTAGDFLVI
jgi:hypothetical protein